MSRYRPSAYPWCSPITDRHRNVELAMQEGYSTAPDKVRALGFGAGMGLPNIKKYTDEMKIDTEKDVGTTISLKVYTAH